MNANTALERRRAAAAKYRPDRVDLLLVGEAPPKMLARYFYFDEVREQDALFRYVAKMILGFVPERTTKSRALSALCDRRVFLIDLSEEPVDGVELAMCVDGLAKRIRRLSPAKIVLVKVTVYDAAYARLKRQGFPVVDERIPFPSSGQQRRFEAAFARALAS